MFCSKCGTEIADSSKFCPNCGKQIISDDNTSVSHNKASWFQEKKKTVISLLIAALACLAVIIIITSVMKSPEELLTENIWYSEVSVSCKEVDWSDSYNYYFRAECDEYNFHLDGEARIFSHETREYYSYHEVTAENIPSYAEWAKDQWNVYPKWEILDDKTLNYRGDYYSWDRSDTHCDCNDDDCRHADTWCITSKYLRIGRTTFTSKKPNCLP